MKRVMTFLVAAMICSFALAQQDGGVLRVATPGEPISLDPIATTDTTSRLIYMQIHDGLVAYDNDFDVVPKLAESWEVSNDGTVYTFRLRPGVTFQNGDSLTSEDVKYAIERVYRDDLMGESQTGVAEVAALDDLTVVVRLRAANAAFIDQFTYLGIPDKKVYQKIGSYNYGLHPVGTGPFQLVSWQPNGPVVLERNETYWLTRPHLDGVEFRAIPESSAAAAELESGSVDMIMSLSAADLLRLRNRSDIGIDIEPTLMYSYVGMNNQLGPLADVRVRRALAMAIPMDQIVDTIFHGVTAVRAYSAFAPNSPAYSADLVADYPKYDPNGARALLTEAGYPDGFETTIYTAAADVGDQLCGLIQTALAQVGVRLDVRSVDLDTLWSKLDAGEAPLWIMGWQPGVDPNGAVYDMFHSDAGTWANGGETYDSARYDNPQVDQWLEEARTLQDMDVRLDLYRKAARVIAYHRNTTLAFHANVHDAFADPQWGIQLVSTYNNVWMEK